MALRTVFFGSSDFAVPPLRALARSHHVVAVYTQPDKPAGRHLELTPTPVKAAALSLGLEVFTPEKLDAAFVSLVEGLHAELLVCVAYGKLLPRGLLAIEGMPALNVHPSSLPAYRGPAPIQAALRGGARETGVTIMWMSAEMDAGDIALARAVPIEQHDDYGSLHDRLAAVAAVVLNEAVALLERGELPRVPQDHARATYAAPIKSPDRRISFDRPAQDVVNLVRSLSPRPAAWMQLSGKRVKVLEARAEPMPVDLAKADPPPQPGDLIATSGGPLIACAAGAVRLLRVVPEGKHAMSGDEFARGLHA